MSPVSAAQCSVFSSRSFRQYYVGQALSLAGDGLRTLAVPLLVYKLTGSAFSTGAAYAPSPSRRCMAASSSSIPFLLGKDLATEAQATLMGAQSVSQTALPAIGGAMLARVRCRALTDH
jgi:hypothetical protein